MKCVVCLAVSASVSASAALPLGLVACDPGSRRERRSDHHARDGRRDQRDQRRCRRRASRRLSSSKPMPSMPASSLSSAFCLRSLPRPHIRRDRLAALRGELARRRPACRSARSESIRASAVSGSAEAPGSPATIRQKIAVLAPEALEGQDLLVDPARLRGLRRADHDLAGRLFQRGDQRRAEVGRGREFVAVAEDRRESLRYRTEFGRPCRRGASAAGRFPGCGAATAPISRRCGCS